MAIAAAAAGIGKTFQLDRKQQPYLLAPPTRLHCQIRRWGPETGERTDPGGKTEQCIVYRSTKPPILFMRRGARCADIGALVWDHNSFL